MRHGIVGPGGIGGLIGTILAHAGEEVVALVRPGTEPQYPREFALESKHGNISAPVRVVARLDEPVNVLWVTTKATQLDEALKSVRPEGRAETVVPLLNGIDHMEVLRRRFGRDAVVAATIAVESERKAPGKFAHLSPFCRLNVLTAGKARLAPALALLEQFGVDVKFIDDEATLLWSKLVFLAPIALTTAAHKTTIGGVVEDPATWAQLEQCAREACAVARAAGAEVPEGDTVAAGIRKLPGHMRSSMEKDVTSGRPIELEAIAGPILRGGQHYGMPTAGTKALAARLREMTAHSSA
jgi:2-dehydropantoate 2-reductase